MTRLEGETETGDSRGRKAETRRSVDHGRSPLWGVGSLSAASARRQSVGERHGQGTEADGQDGEPDCEHRPIEGEPGRSVDLARRTERRQWREEHGESHSKRRSEDNATKKSKDGVPRHGQQVGPEGAEDVEVLALRP
jgi:hypothetical protein